MLSGHFPDVEGTSSQQEVSQSLLDTDSASLPRAFDSELAIASTLPSGTASPHEMEIDPGIGARPGLTTHADIRHDDTGAAETKTIDHQMLETGDVAMGREETLSTVTDSSVHRPYATKTLAHLEQLVDGTNGDGRMEETQLNAETDTLHDEIPSVQDPSLSQTSESAYTTPTTDDTPSYIPNQAAGPWPYALQTIPQPPPGMSGIAPVEALKTVLPSSGMNVDLHSQDSLSNAKDEDMDEDMDSELSDGDDLRGDFETAMSDNFDFPGSFAYGKTDLQALNPCICLEGVGLIGLPLSPRDAALVIQHARQAPFGHADKTIVDKDVRHTWEIKPSQLAFTNPGWHKYVEETAWTVCDALGAKVPVGALRCELHKLLLYEPGGHFRAHKDTAKAPGMFGTMIIILPSQYTGGAISLSHSGKEETFDFASTSLTNTSILSWYTDVIHQVNPVVSGYRLALSFNLVHVNSSVPPSLPDMTQAVQELRQVLKKWKKGCYHTEDNTKFLAYVLEHKYSEVELASGAGCLKGKDAHKLGHIRPQTSELEFKICFGRLEFHISGTADGYGYGFNKRRRYGGWGDRAPPSGVPDMLEDEEREYCIENLVDIHGKQILGKKQQLSTDEVNIVPEEYFAGEEPDEEDYEGYTGNESSTVEQYYRRTVLVLIPENRAMRLLLNAGGLNYVISILKDQKANPPTEDNLRLFDTIMLNLQSKHAYDRSAADTLYDLAMEWSKLDLWKRVVSTMFLGRDTMESSKLLSAVEQFGFEELQSVLDEIIATQSHLNTKLTLLDTIQNRALELLEPSKQHLAKSWRKQNVIQILGTLRNPSPQEVPVLVPLLEEMGLGTFADNVVPKLAADASKQYHFWIAFIKTLYARKASYPDESQPELARLLDSCLLLILPLWDDAPMKYSYSDTKQNRIGRVVELLDLCLQTERLPQCKIVLASVFTSKGLVSNKFVDLYIPLIERMQPLLRQHGMDLLVPPFCEVMQIFVGTYLNEILGLPTTTPKLAIRQIGCGCDDCQKLDDFLTGNLSQILIRLPMSRKSHLEQCLTSAVDLASYRVVTTGSPYGLDITKSKSLIKGGLWASRVSQARKFLAQVGDQAFLQSLMGHRYADIEKALNGMQLFMLPINVQSPSSTRLSQPTVPLTASASSSTSKTHFNSSLSNSHQATAPTKGVKRKKKMFPAADTEVIDLCSD